MRFKQIKHTGKIGFISCLLTAVLCSPAASYAEGSIQSYSKTLSYNGKSYTVKWISADLSDPYLRVKPVTASGGIGHVESFDAMMTRSHAAAGINGAFFDAYVEDDSARYPNGLMIRSGELLHSGNNQSFMVLADKTPLIQRIQTGQAVSVTHQGNTYTFSTWGFNKYYGDTNIDQIVWYTNDFGKRIDFPNSTKIVIQEGIVTAITTDSADIPPDGQICLVGHSDNNSTHVLPNVHVGDQIGFTASYTDSDTGASSALPAIDAAVGAGPKLLTSGVVDIDYARDGFSDARITSQANVRSFIGIDGSQHLVMGTLSSATIPDMAQVLLQLGLTDAMNLDGGASTALYAEGNVLTAPGRLLSNAFVVERLDYPQIQLTVNEQFVHEFRGYLQHETSMVPFRGILERIGAEFHWDDSSRTLSVHYGDQQLVLHPDDTVMHLNGAPLSLDQAPTIVDGHIYIPLRAVIEGLGGHVEWNPQLYRAILTIP